MKREKCLEWPGMLHRKSIDGHFVSDKVAEWAFVHSTNKSLNFKVRFSEDIHAYPCVEGLKETET